jgi:hypothetical protein
LSEELKVMRELEVAWIVRGREDVLSDKEPEDTKEFLKKICTGRRKSYE